MTNAETMREIATIVDDWRWGHVTDTGATERISRALRDEAPAEYRQPLIETRVDP